MPSVWMGAEMCFERIRNHGRCGLVLWILAFVFAWREAHLWAQDPVEAPAAETANIAAFVTLEGTISDTVTATVRRTALELQSQALKEKRQAFLILELTAGSSEFHHVYALAEFLTSEATANIKTICWVPKSVSGTNVVVALACSEVVMHPDARLGDLGRGQSLPGGDQGVVRSIIAKRRNRRVTEALVNGLMDPTAVVMQVTLEPAPGTVEKRLVTQTEAQRLREASVAVRDSQTLKEAGTPWMIGAVQAREWDILISQTASSRREVAEAFSLPREALRERPALQGDQHVELIEIKGPIEPILASFLNRQIERAVSNGAKIIIFEVDSPGGYLIESEELSLAIAELKSRGVHAVAYIPKAAISGAAIISLGCDDIYMHPEAQMGDAGVIVETAAGGAFERAPEKMISPLMQTMARQAREKDRPVALLQAMVDRDLEVFQVTHKTRGTVTYMSESEIHEAGDEWVKGLLVPESRKGLLLTVNGRRGHELGLAQSPVNDFSELRARLGIPPEQRLVAMQRTWVDDLVFLLNYPPIMGFLFFVGLVAIYLELHTMTGVCGLVAALCFALFFWSKVLGGTAGSLEIVLFLIGVGCLLLELLVLPGFGVFGVTGILLVLASIIMASQTFGHLGPTQSDTGQALQTIKILGGAVFGLVITAVALSKFLPRIPLFNDMILTPPSALQDAAPRLRPELVAGTAALPGQSGVALTLLRPSGKAEINGQPLDVVSEGSFIPEGSTIEVVQCIGNRIVVRKV